MTDKEYAECVDRLVDNMKTNVITTDETVSDSYGSKVDRLVDSMGSWLKCTYSEGIQSTSQVV